MPTPIFTSKIYKRELFSYSFIQTKAHTKIRMQVFTEEVHTGTMKKTFFLLRTYLPSILQSTCINEFGISFRKEVMRTELGHLFEHILLEYLCQGKLEKGHKEAVFQGTTDWNWQKDPRGVFHITISLSKEDFDIFPSAFNKTLLLFEYILEYHSQKAATPFVQFSSLISEESTLL